MIAALFVFVFLPHVGSSLAYGQAVGDGAQCSAAVALIDSPNKDKQREVVSDILANMSALDQAYAAKGKGEILSKMTEEGRKGSALLVVSRYAKSSQTCLSKIWPSTLIRASAPCRVALASISLRAASGEARCSARPSSCAQKVRWTPRSTADPHRQQYSLNARPICHIPIRPMRLPSDSRRAYLDGCGISSSLANLRKIERREESGDIGLGQVEPRLGDTRE